MARTGEIELQFGNERRLFRLNIGQLRAIEERCGAGLPHILAALSPAVQGVLMGLSLGQMIAQGMTKVVYINKVFGDCVRTSTDYLTQDAVFLRTPQQVLHDWFNKNRKHMRRDGITAFQELLDQSKEWNLK